MFIKNKDYNLLETRRDVGNDGTQQYSWYFGVVGVKEIVWSSKVKIEMYPLSFKM